MRICKMCKRPYTQEMLDDLRKQKSDRIKEARSLAKINGERVGASRKYSYERILTLRANGLTIREIAKIVGCSTAPVQNAIKESK